MTAAYTDPWSDDAREQHADRMLDAFVFKGIAYRHRPGPPIDEQAWLRDGYVATITGEVYNARHLG